MRIAINHRYFRPHGGAEGYLWTFAHKLAERGHEVHLFCSKFTASVPEKMIRHDVSLLPLGESLKALSFARNSRSLLCRESFDGTICLGKTTYGDIYRDGSGCMKHFGEYKRKYEAAAGRSLSIKQAAFRHLERLRFSPGAFGHIVTISGMVKKQILELYDLPKDGITVIHPGVDTSRFQSKDREEWRAEIRRSYGIPDDAVMGITVANGFTRKGIEPLLNALGRLKTDSWRFMVLGRDKQLSRYKQLAEKLGIDSRVLFCGWKEEMEHHLAASDFFVLNSRFDAFGNSTMEALASGLPCIVSAKAGSSEVVTDGVNGYVISDPDDAEELSEAIGGLIADTTLRNELSRNALDTARKNSIDDNIDAYLSILEGISS